MEGLLGLLPFAIVALACPLMMIFMMRGMHGGHSEQSGHVGYAATDAAGQGDARDDATAARLQAMEEQVTALRRELAERDAEKLGLGRDGRS